MNDDASKPKDSSEIPPPWDRETGKTRLPEPGSFEKTQPIRPPTVEDVLEVFGHFRQDLIEQIDKRDERILLAVHDIRSIIAEHYQRETARGDEHTKLIRKEIERGDDHAKWIQQLRNRSHRFATEQQTLSIRLSIIEQHLGIDIPDVPPTPSEPEPE